MSRFHYLMFAMLLTVTAWGVPVRPPAAVSLASVPHGKDVLEKAVSGLQGHTVNVSLLAGKNYMVSNCLGIHASAGQFYARFSGPTIRYLPGSIELEMEAERISLDGLSLRMRPNPGNVSNPCSFGGRFSVGGSASRVKLVVTIDPKISVDDCQMLNLGGPQVRVSIGGLNLKPLQNDLDNVAKNMLEDALNEFFRIFLTEQLSAGINLALVTPAAGFVCESKVALYKAYMEQLAVGNQVYALPVDLVKTLRLHYPNIDLQKVRFAYSGRQEPGNATTDCFRTFYGERQFVDHLRQKTLTSYDWSWLLHELRHSEQCEERGSREAYAKMWFKDIALSLLTTNLQSGKYFRELHDHMPMEEDAEARAHEVFQKLFEHDF